MSTRSSISPSASGGSSSARSGLLAACALVAACAGPLDHPERFAYLLDDADGGAVSDAGAGDAGSRDAGSLDGGGPSDGGDAGCDPVATILAPTCATAVCHGAGAQQGNLDLQSPGMPGRLVGTPSFGGPGLLIDPAHPDSSAMLTKVSASPPFGSSMPLLGQPLTAAEVSCLRDWIHRAAGR